LAESPLKLYGLIAGCALLTHIDSDVISAIIAFFLIIFLIVQIELGSFFLLVFSILAPDRVVYKIFGEENLIINSIFLNKFNGITYIVPIILVALGVVIFYMPWRAIRLKKNILMFLVLPLIIPIHGLLTSTDLRILISDFRYLIVPLTIFGVFSASKVPGSSLLKILNATLIVKIAFIILISLILSKPSLTYWGYAVYLIPLVLILNYDEPLLLKMMLMILTLIIVLTFPARGRIICFIYLYIISFFISGYRYRIINIVLITFCLLLIVPWLLNSYPDGQWLRFTIWKLNTFNIFSELSRSANMRLLEFCNIINEQIELVYPLFIGKGYGGYFVDNYIPFDYQAIIGGGAFPEEHIINRTFYDPHTNINFLLLKAGLFPAIIFFAGLSYFGFRKYNYSTDWKIKARYVMLFLPILGIIMVSVKISIVFGVYLYLLSIIYPGEKLSINKMKLVR